MKEEEKKRKKKTEILHNRITWESDAGRSTPNIKNRRYIEIGLIYKPLKPYFIFEIWSSMSFKKVSNAFYRLEKPT
jgi:hypothetical protein